MTGTVSPAPARLGSAARARAATMDEIALREPEPVEPP